MRTHLRESMLALLLIGILATGCDTGTKKASENSITFDSISVEKTYHLLDNPDNPNCNLEIKFVYPRKYSDKEVLKNLQRQFVSSYFGENYEQLSPEEAVRKYTDDYLAAYKDLEEDYKAEVAKSDETPVGSWFSYYEMSSDDIAFNQDDIISYTVSFENYTGGAHGAHSYNNHVVNLKTGKPITEEEIFVDNYQDNLARILVDQIAKQNNVSDAKELENIGFFSVDEIFPNGNFLVDETGITARLTTKSKSCFSSSPRQWRKDTFSSPIASATACPTLIFFPILSTRWKWVSGNKIAKGMPGKPPPVPRSITEEPGLKRSISVIPSE